MTGIWRSDTQAFPISVRIHHSQNVSVNINDFIHVYTHTHRWINWDMMQWHSNIFDCQFVYLFLTVCVDVSCLIYHLSYVYKLWIYVSFAEYNLFYRALLQERPIILRNLMIVAPPWEENWPRCHDADTHKYMHMYIYRNTLIYIYMCITYLYVHMYAYI